MKILFSIIMTCIIVSLHVSCDSNQKKIAIDENLIHFISENPIYSSEVPLSYETSIFFVQGDNGKIIKLDPRELEEIYNKYYSSWKYEKFVREALNQKLIIKAKDKGQIFELNKDVMDSYSSHNFVDFMKLYCEIIATNRYMLKYDILNNRTLSLFYYAFINNYLASFDDFLGVFYISKASRHTDDKNKED